MRNIYKVFVLAALLTSQYAIADDTMPPNGANDKPCIVIAQACKDAGFVEMKSETKGVWRNCMEPIISGQTVSGVKVDSAVVKACRTRKIDEMEMQLKKLKQVQ